MHNSITSRILLSAILLCLTACSHVTDPPGAGSTATQAANAGNFTRTVFLGDSLTAGYQSSSLIDTSQPHGWAPLLATQANFSIALPLILPPGAPNQLTLVHLGPPPVLGQLPGVTLGRDDFTLQPTNLAVPGAVLNDVLNTVPVLVPTTSQQIINQLILAYPGFGYGKALSQAQQAVAANPTTIFLWIGNNDALVADFTGTPSSMTPIATFTSEYHALIAYLTANTSAHLVIANIPDVTAIAYLQPAALILAEYSAATGVPAANLSVLFGISPGDYVNQTGLAQIPLILAGTQKTPITDAGVLSAAEVVTARANVTAFNQVIAAQASASAATLVDINALFATVSANGVTVNGITGTTGFLGGIFSLDGVHPTNTGYAVIANKVIDTMNTALKTTIPDVNLVPIAAADPLFPPYPGHKSIGSNPATQVMPVVPALSADRMLELMGRTPIIP